MFTVHVDPIELFGWQGWRLKSGPLSVSVFPSIGGRILSVRFEGKELLFVPKDHHGETYDFSQVEDLNMKKKELGFRTWGGDKTWVAPQSSWSEGIPPLELDSAPYVLSWQEQTAVMTSPICRETGLQIIRKVSVDKESFVTLEESFLNTTQQPILKGIWNVTQIPRPCEFFIPARKGAFRSYHHEDKTLPEVKSIFKEEHGWVEVFCHAPTLFKCGGIPTEGKVLIKMPLGGPKELVWLKTFDLDIHATFAHRSTVEIFNSDQADYAEVELHAPLVEIQPGALVSFSQQWHFKKL